MDLVLKPGTVIDHSVRIAARAYSLPSASLEKPALTVQGDGITVDFNGAELRGTPLTVDPDRREGLALRVIGKNVTIRNAKIRGYRFGILARDCPGLKLANCDLSYNRKDRLRSTVEKEDLSDWMSYHQNEKDEWLRYGAAIYLRDCRGVEVKGCKVVSGQNALLMTRCDRALVWNNDFSYNSALGIGLYRSSEGKYMHNRLDYNIRGFSYGVYNRGQDSAAILAFEQCHRNVFAYNSATHSGDGFFLWAGQSTMDTGQGGCNDNLLYGNDFSHAVTNGIEATFSRNKFVYNRVDGCFHGVWGGYSYDSVIAFNQFRDNERGIAIEHGQTNSIRGNKFSGGDVGIALWADPVADPNWGYPKRRDVRSRDTNIVGNVFHRVPLPLDLKDSSLQVEGNGFYGIAELRQGGAVTFEPTVMGNQYLNGAKPIATLVGPIHEMNDSRYFPPETVWGPLRNVRIEDNGNGTRSIFGTLSRHQDEPEILKFAPKPLSGGLDPFLAKGHEQGWRTIIVDEWGPYDGRRPLLWPKRAVAGAAPAPGATSRGSGRLRPAAPKSKTAYEILGPKGRWRVVRAVGVKLPTSFGTVPGIMQIGVDPKRVGEVAVELEYVGEETVDARGVVTPAGKPVRFGFSRYQAPMAWDVDFYPWDPKSQDPRENEAWRSNPILAQTRVDTLEFAGYGRFAPKVPATHFATIAEGTVELPRGDWELKTTTDDGLRIFVDDVKIIDSWKYQGPTDYAAKLKGGKHRIRVEHFQIDGYAALKVALVPAAK
ncbi:hypothetical protein EON79_02705 [bacterium]|nr:MAG: hypothetical protein EON79_02705 [bacterium]